MSNNSIQIEPIHHRKTETKRASSLYVSISRFIKMKTDIRKHRTLPNNTYAFEKKCHVEHITHNNEFDEKIQLDDTPEKFYTTPLAPPPVNHHRTWLAPHRNQSVLPSRSVAMSQTPTDHALEEEVEDEGEEFEFSCFYSRNLDESDEEEEETIEQEYYNYALEDQETATDPYTLALQRLSGVPSSPTCSRQRVNTAVLISLSPCSLAAANAARQKRQKIRTLQY